MRHLTIALALGVAAATVMAGDRRNTAPPTLYLQECGSCHVPYPAKGLGPGAWNRIVDGLPRHFGTDASLDPAATALLREYLVAHAATRAAGELPPELRMTRGTWFTREHRDVPAAAWSRPAVRSAANCAACHTNADRGVFDEHDVRIPR